MPPKDTFRPTVYFKPDKSMPATGFQVSYIEIHGELGERARRAQLTSGLSRSKFVKACIEFALDHMQETP